MRRKGSDSAERGPDSAERGVLPTLAYLAIIVAMVLVFVFGFSPWGH